MEIESLLYALL